MEDKLVTLAILTYSKAQILKNILENEGIESYIHNVNQIQPVVSSGVRVRIKESDLPHALKITESEAWLSEEVTEEKEVELSSRSKILIPVDFSVSSMKACEIGFHLAKVMQQEIVLLHVYFTPLHAAAIAYGDVFNYQVGDDVKQSAMLKNKASADLASFAEQLKSHISTGKYPDVPFTTTLREGIAEEEILRCAKKINPLLIVMGTRGSGQKEIDLIGSVTAEVIDRSQHTTLAIPERTSFEKMHQMKRIGFLTNFDQRDLVAFDSFVRNEMRQFKPAVNFIHIAENEDKWSEVKLAGIKEYFSKQYPDMSATHNVLQNNSTFLNTLEEYVAAYKIDAIVVSSYRRNIFARLFNPSLAKRMVFHADTPIFVISDK